MAMTRKDLNQAFCEAVMSEFADVPDESQITFAFSEKFELKMQKLIACQKKSYWKYVNTAKKRVAVAVISLLSMFMLAMGNEDVRASMLQWCENVYEEYIHYYFEGETTKLIEHEYQLTVIPDGFEVVSTRKDLKWIVTEYENEIGDSICFVQSITDAYELHIDKEKLNWSSTIINKKEVKLFENEYLKGAIWVENGYVFELYYVGCVEFKVIIEVIENLSHS